jgi:uncharacterized protein YaaN involved in tellurite resistance
MEPVMTATATSAAPVLQDATALTQIMEKESSLTDADQKKIAEYKSSVNLNDSHSILQFGTPAQKGISEFADTILQSVKIKDTGEEGKVLSELMLKIKDLDAGSLSPSGGGFLSSLPLIGGLMDSGKKFLAKYDSVSGTIEKLIDELHATRNGLIRDVEMFDGLYKKNLEFFRDLTLYIEAGEQLLEHASKVELPAMQKEAQDSGDQLKAQEYNDFAAMINRFEKKIHDLKLSRMISLQSGPQIRLIQNTNHVLVEKIQSSILNTIPLWKNQITIAIGLIRQKKALEVQQEVTKTTNDMLTRNSEMLKISSIEAAKESEKGIVEIETLRKVHENLISTIEETLKIQSDGKQKRRDAEVELIRLEQDLKTKLMDVKGTV